MNQISHEWLRSAKDDISLIHRIEDDKDLTHLAAFHSQQAIEKILKALIEADGKTVPKTHSLKRLFALNEGKVAEPDGDIVDLLDELYIEARYPGDLGLLPCGKPTREEAAEFIDCACQLYAVVATKLGAKVEQ